MPPKKTAKTSSVPPPTANIRTTRSRKQALDEQELDDMSEKAGTNAATELTIQDTVTPSQPAIAMCVLPTCSSSGCQGNHSALEVAPSKKHSWNALFQEKLAQLEAQQAALDQHKVEYVEWELDQDAIIEEDTKNTVKSLSDVEGESKNIEMGGTDDEGEVSGQLDENLEVEVAKETSKVPIVSFSSEHWDMCTDEPSRRGRRSLCEVSRIMKWTQSRQDLLQAKRKPQARTLKNKGQPKRSRRSQ